MTPNDVKMVDDLLVQWGRQMKNTWYREIGDRRETTISKAMRETIRTKKRQQSKKITANGKQTQTFKPRLVFTTPEVDLVEQIVRSMGKVYKNVVIQMYMKSGPNQLRAERLKMSLAQYKICVKVAQGIVYGAFRATHIKP